MSVIRAAVDGGPTQQVPTAILAYSTTLTVVHVPQLKVMNVSDDCGNTHVVTLFPKEKEKCSCPANSTCCHIIAARRSIGIEDMQRKPMIMAILAKNKRLRTSHFDTHTHTLAPHTHPCSTHTHSNTFRDSLWIGFTFPCSAASYTDSCLHCMQVIARQEIRTQKTKARWCFVHTSCGFGCKQVSSKRA